MYIFPIIHNLVSIVTITTTQTINLSNMDHKSIINNQFSCTVWQRDMKLCFMKHAIIRTQDRIHRSLPTRDCCVSAPANMSVSSMNRIQRCKNKICHYTWQCWHRNLTWHDTRMLTHRQCLPTNQAWAEIQGLLASNIQHRCGIVE